MLARKRPIPCGFKCASFFFSVFASFASLAAPPDLENYETVVGGAVDIVTGTSVEGSALYGGLQPDYTVDTDSPRFLPLFDLADEMNLGKPAPISASVVTLKSERESAGKMRWFYSKP